MCADQTADNPSIASGMDSKIQLPVCADVRETLAVFICDQSPGFELFQITDQISYS